MNIDNADVKISNITCIHKSDLKLNLQNKENLMLNISNKFTEMHVNEIMMIEENMTLLNFYFQSKHCRKMKKNAMKKQYDNMHIKNLLLLINKNSKRHSSIIEFLINEIYKKKTKKMLLINTDKNTKKN